MPGIGFNSKIDGSEIRREYGLNSEDQVIFFMGWLYRFSGLQELIIEFNKIHLEYPKLRILIVGDGDAFDELFKLRNKFKLEHKIIMTGKQPYDNIPELISAGDVCILPSRINDIMKDIVPIKIYEYLSMKKPVISTKLPGVMREFGEITDSFMQMIRKNY